MFTEIHVFANNKEHVTGEIISMEAIMHALQGIVTIMILISIGFILAKCGWFEEHSEAMIARLVTQLCLPAYMLVNLTTTFTHDELMSMSSGLFVPILSIFLCYFIGKGVAALIKVPRSRRGVFCSVFFTANSIFIGLPLCLALFGESGSPYVMLYYIANTLTFSTIAVHDIAQDAGFDAPLFSIGTLKAVLSPPLFGFIFGIIMVMLNLHLPGPLLTSCRYIGNMVTPLAMLFIGIAISKYRWADIHFDFELLVAMVGRFGVAPVCVFVLLPIFHLPILMSQVFVMQAAMPAMTNTAIVAKAYGGDYEYAAKLTVVSVFVAVITTPFYMWILQG